MNKIVRTALSTAAVLASLAAGQAQASLVAFQTFTGNVGVSTDGWGSTSSSGTIQAFVPTGATVRAAYLYTSTTVPNASFSGTLNGSAVSYSTALGVSNGYLAAYRADVTSIVKTAIDNGAGGTYNLSISESNTGAQDGSALVVVYEQAALALATVGILDGFASPTGDTTTINFANALNPNVLGFFAEMRLGIGYSYDGVGCTGSGQVSQVSVNGTRITNNAGCSDDAAGTPGNGNLITMGGSDDAFAPLLPTTAQDHERYNLVPQITEGATSIRVDTRNPSNDDNIFLAVFHVAGQAAINAPAPAATDVPEPMGLGLVGLALSGLALQRRRQARRG